MPTYFQFMVKTILCGTQFDHPLPIVIYLDDIAMYGDTQEQTLEDMFISIKLLTAAGFILNLHKTQMV